MAKDLDRHLVALGGVRLLPCWLGDSTAGDLNVQLTEWAGQLLPLLTSQHRESPAGDQQPWSGSEVA